MPNAVNVTYAVYIDWAYSGSGSPDFTQPIDTITSYVNSVSCTLGITRPDENVAYTGTCTLTLNNADRRFSPLYASGAYYDNLVGGKPVKITVTQSGSTYTIWTGYTRQIKVTTGQYAAREATIECVDFMARLQDEMVAIPLQENVSASTLLRCVVNTTMKMAIATGTFTIGAGNAANNDTVAINGQTLTFKTTLSGGSNEVKIGLAEVDTLTNFVAAINHDTGAGTTYSSTTDTFPVSAASTTGGGFNITGASAGSYAVGTSGGTAYQAGSRFTGVGGVLTTITVKFNASTGTPTSTATWEIQADTGGLPDGTVLQSGTFTPTASATNTINVGSGITLTSTTTYHLVIRSTSAQTNGNYWNVDVTNDTLSTAASLSKAGSTWSALTAYDLVCSIYTPCVATLTAQVRGTTGNYSLAESGANLSVSGAALSGGADYTPSSYEAGDETFTVAADEWSSNDTNGMTAVQDVIDSEQGLFWIARDGTITFKARNYLFKRPSAASALTLNSEHTDFDATMDQEQIANRVEVEARPRAQVASGVVAESKATITVPGQSGTARWNGTVVLPGGGSTTVKLPFTDATTGKQCGAKSLVLPLVATTDFTVNDMPDGSGFDYTGSNGTTFAFSYAVNGSNIEISITNSALGPLYITKLQVRGVAVVTYDPQVFAVEDATSQDTYGKRVKSVSLPLASTPVYAQSLAEYTLGRYKDPAFRVNSISFGGQNLIGAVKLYSLEIGDILTLTDYQSAITAQKYMITGIAVNSLTPRAPGEITLFVRRLDDLTYWILEDATYGVLGTTSRLGV